MTVSRLPARRDLDPFAGTGTTPAVAARLGRHAIEVELNPTYLELIRERYAHIAPNPTTKEAA
jgi:DNA modification methylase